MASAETAPAGTADNTEHTSPAQARVKHAIKTSLSLTAAYLIPMGIGWPQPETAAITVMLITATGMTSDSLQKGVMRVLGTVVGAIIGLTLIALFPQDRMTYLIAASITVSIIAYLYNAYQGDSTLFMLAAVVTLMVFNGGDAEGAFLYGVDRAFMTAFGVIVYTIVASTLWPVRAVDNTRKLAATVASGYHRAFRLLCYPVTEGPDNSNEELARLLASEDAFQTHFTSIRRYADSVEVYIDEWLCVVACYEELQAVLLPALRQENRHGVQFDQYLENYPEVAANIEGMFAQLESSWQGRPVSDRRETITVQHKTGSLRNAPHLTIAAVVTRAEVLNRLQDILIDLNRALGSMAFDRGGFVSRRKPRGKPLFVWKDLENLKTAARMFITFWLATAVWIGINPPLGFTFVALCSVLVLLVSYTPVTPKLLIILFTMGFAFALPAYVFLLPHMTHWFELATFMFAYAFFGFFVFQGPVSLFFMLGLFTLGIQNTMSYHFDIILLAAVTLYLLCALLIITTHFPFTSKPERLYPSLCRRFFRSCARALYIAGDFRRRPRHTPVAYGSNLLAKLHTWGPRIDSTFFKANSAQKISRLNQACELLYGQIEVLLMRRNEFAGNRLITANQNPGEPRLLVALCNALAVPGNADETEFSNIDSKLTGIRERLDSLRAERELQQYQPAELAQFFVYLNMQHAILSSLRECFTASQALDWSELRETRF